MYTHSQPAVASSLWGRCYIIDYAISLFVAIRLQRNYCFIKWFVNTLAVFIYLPVSRRLRFGPVLDLQSVGPQIVVLPATTVCCYTLHSVWPTALWSFHQFMQTVRLKMCACFHACALLMIDGPNVNCFTVIVGRISAWRDSRNRCNLRQLATRWMVREQAAQCTLLVMLTARDHCHSVNASLRLFLSRHFACTCNCGISLGASRVITVSAVQRALLFR